MNADAFRQLYDYHFTINRKIWDECVVVLTQQQFIQAEDYSVGSVRNQVVHMLNIDDRWFCGLRGEELPGFLNPIDYHQREAIRQMWDEVEAKMRAYLEDLRDDMLLGAAFPGDTRPDAFRLWQVLQHVIVHGADHRAQLLALLNKLGIATFGQDFAYYFMGRM